MEEKYPTLNFCLLSSEKKNLIPILTQWNFYQLKIPRREAKYSLVEVLV